MMTEHPARRLVCLIGGPVDGPAFTEEIRRQAYYAGVLATYVGFTVCTPHPTGVGYWAVEGANDAGGLTIAFGLSRESNAQLVLNVRDATFAGVGDIVLLCSPDAALAQAVRQSQSAWTQPTLVWGGALVEGCGYCALVDYYSVRGWLYDRAEELFRQRRQNSALLKTQAARALGWTQLTLTPSP